jgi:hypothetical protein
MAAWVIKQTKQGCLMEPIIRVYQIGQEGPLGMIAIFLGEGYFKIKSKVNDTLEAVVKASHIRE